MDGTVELCFRVVWADASGALVSFWETTGISSYCVLCDIHVCKCWMKLQNKGSCIYSPFNGLSSKVTNRMLYSSLMSQSHFKRQFWTLYVAVKLLIAIINCHKYHSSVSFLSYISCRGGPTFNITRASTNYYSYRLSTDGYSAHCGHSCFDNVDEVSQFVTCKMF